VHLCSLREFAYYAAVAVAERDVVIPGRRERKKLETRRALAAAALSLAAERGPDQITIEEIADAADVSVRTFFNYFPSKEAAIVAWDHERVATLHAELRDRPLSEAPLEALHRVLLHAFDEYAEDAATRFLRMKVVRENGSLLPHHLAAMAELERGFVKAIAERLDVDPHDNLYPSLVVGAAVAAMRLTINKWELSGRAVPWPTLCDDAFTVLAAGFAPSSAHPAPTKRPARSRS
jgi:AcrR family transcriptional regulator